MTRVPKVADEEPADVTADRLHSASIHLLRRLRTTDTQAGLTGPQLSALSVIVFRGPISVGALASAEQVRPPTISRLLAEMERRGLVERVADSRDARVQLMRATPAGEHLLTEGRARRVAQLAQGISALPPDEREVLRRAATLIARLGGAEAT